MSMWLCLGNHQLILSLLAMSSTTSPRLEDQSSVRVWLEDIERATHWLVFREDTLTTSLLWLSLNTYPVLWLDQSMLLQVSHSMHVPFIHSLYTWSPLSYWASLAPWWAISPVGVIQFPVLGLQQWLLSVKHLRERFPRNISPEYVTELLLISVPFHFKCWQWTTQQLSLNTI